MNINDKLLSEENLIANGFIQDKEINNCWYYKGVPYDITDIQGKQEVLDILDNLQYEQYYNNYDYDTVEVNTRVTKTITVERTKEILPTHKEIMTNTSAREYNFLCMLISKSNFNKEGEKMEAYIYEKDLKSKLDELKAKGIKVPSKNSMKAYLNILSEITFDGDTKLVKKENSPNGIVYKIAQNYEGKWFITIPKEQLNELLITASKEALKLYCIIKYTVEANENKYTPITRSYLVRHMGLSEGISSEKYISTITTALRKLGYIKIEVEHIKELDEKGNTICKDKNYFQLTTFEEWKTLNKTIGIKNKK